MDIISTYREVGFFPWGCRVSGTTAKSVKRVIARQAPVGAAIALVRSWGP
jgi:hypothetical protein